MTAAEMYHRYLTAEAAILEGKAVRFGERMLTHEDLQWVQTGRREWEAKAAAETAGSAGQPARKPFQIVL
jgi:hypothetical protein